VSIGNAYTYSNCDSYSYPCTYANFDATTTDTYAYSNSNPNSNCDTDAHEPTWQHMPPANDDRPYQGS
jgi:hypothetical protein